MQEKGNNVTSHIVKGLVLAAVLAVYLIAGELTHASTAEWFGWVKLGIIIAGVAGGVIYYGAQMRGNVNFSMLLVHGLKLTAVLTCMYFIFSLLEMYVFFPGYLDELVKQGLAAAAKSGSINQKKVAENMAQARKVTAVMLMAGVVMGTLIMGLLASLLGTALAKKSPSAAL